MYPDCNICGCDVNYGAIECLGTYDMFKGHSYFPATPLPTSSVPLEGWEEIIRALNNNYKICSIPDCKDFN